MLIYNIKTQVEFDLGYNPLIFYWDWDFYKNIVQKLVSAQIAGASVSYGHISGLYTPNKQSFMGYTRVSWWSVCRLEIVDFLVWDITLKLQEKSTSNVVGK